MGVLRAQWSTRDYVAQDANFRRRVASARAVIAASTRLGAGCMGTTQGESEEKRKNDECRSKFMGTT